MSLNWLMVKPARPGGFFYGSLFLQRGRAMASSYTQTI
ncbi:hypothetical protein CJA_3473 [Cellvibrio japonicus Ueda107]|uniref:Uncharacterized protein n=1 Tax=Cellvibrio japonicus (strain Ueda107) TaxID=498211 RepID=B3PG19_CELJU|nr:hypothetical protein CJA_3473 [Cellvibrio japonicus Ueda107]